MQKKKKNVQLFIVPASMVFSFRYVFIILLPREYHIISNVRNNEVISDIKPYSRLISIKLYALHFPYIWKKNQIIFVSDIIALRIDFLHNGKKPTEMITIISIFNFYGIFSIFFVFVLFLAFSIII